MRRRIFQTETEVIIVSTKENPDGTESTSVATIRSCPDDPPLVSGAGFFTGSLGERDGGQLFGLGMDRFSWG